MGVFDFIKKEQNNKKNLVIVNDSNKIEDKFSKAIIPFFDQLTMPENVRNLLWIADGKYKNYFPNDKNKVIFENELFKIYFEGFEEPSLIYTNLPINITKKNQNKSIGYYPTYTRLTPSERFTYLQWLCDISNSIDIGYVFIFYYGLERHLIYSKYKDAVETILLLRQFHKNNSFYSYSSSALIMSAIFHKDKDTLLKILDDIEEGNYSGNLLLISKYLMKLDISAKEIVSLSNAVGFKNKRYLKNYPDIFVEKLESILTSEFGKSSLPFYNLNTEFNLKEELVFANTSFTSNVRSPLLPSIIDNEEFKTSINKILVLSHELVKKDLAEKRRGKNKHII